MCKINRVSLSSQIILTAMTVCFISPLTALPKAKKVVHGDVEMSNTSHHLKIKTSDKAIINYDSFNIDEGQQVTFIQPKAGSVVLNRVQGSETSSLMGLLNANGRVFLVNPNGIVIGKSGMINAASFIASTLDIADSDFLSDRFQFTLKPGTENSSIVHQGTISCPEGAIGLLAPKIQSEGAILAKAGKVVLASGEKVTLDFSGDGLMSFSVEGDVKDALIEHLGTIDALGGEVYLKLKVADEALKRIVNADHIEIASQMVEENGIIRLVGNSHIAADAISITGDGKSEITVNGTLDVSSLASGQKGGTVQIFGNRLILEGANILASGDAGGGTVLIGGEYKGAGDMQKSQFSFMDAASSIYADAKTTGDGGRVILWSDKNTFFNGTIYARGGSESGNGGFIETSGKKGLNVSATGFVNASAPFGKSGNWLLDPLTINVMTGGAGTLAQAANCVDSTTNLIIDPVTIGTAIANVVLCADGEGGAITVTNPFTVGGGNGITFGSAGARPVPINLNADITTTGTGFVTLLGNTTLGAAVTITTASGAVIIDGNVDSTAAGAGSLNITSTSGNIAINGDMGAAQSLTGLVLNSGSGSLTVQSVGADPGIPGSTGGLTFTGGAGITLNGTGYTTSGAPGQAYHSNVILGANTSIVSTNQPIVFSGTITGAAAGAQGLNVNAGTNTVTFGGTIGATALSDVIVNGSVGGTIVLGGAATGVTTFYDQLYGLPVTLGTSTTFTTSNSPVTFASTVNGSAGGFGLTVAAGNGAITAGVIGSTGVAIGAVSMTGNGGITLNGVGLGTPGAGAVTLNSLVGIKLNNGTYNAASHNYSGSVTLGANTTITSNSGNATMTGAIDGDGVSRNLTITTSGNVAITGSIGEKSAIGTLIITSNTISLGGIGGAGTAGSLPGVTGTTELNATGNINFTGGFYYGNNATYTAGGANNFNIQSTVLTNFNSTTGGISFVGGTVNLAPGASGSSLILTTNNAPVSIPKIAGTVSAHLIVNAGTGSATVGDAPTSFLDIFLQGLPVNIPGSLTADTINVISGSGITISPGGTLTAADTLLLNATNGDVGTVGTPILISAAGGIVTVGATGNAYIKGPTGDLTVHCLPNNPPAHVFYDGSGAGPFNPVDIGCTSAALFPLTIPITNKLVSFVAIYNFRAAGGAVFDAFGFSLASDFFFQEDKAESGNCTADGCSCDYNIYNSLRDLDTKCMYNKINMSQPQALAKPWFLGLLALPVAYFVYRRFRKT